MEKEIKVGVTLKNINKIFESNCNRELIKNDITRSQHHVLMYILINSKNVSEINQKDIERTFNLSNPTVTGILNRLEAKSFITRETSSKDARYKKICLTEKAINIGKELKEKGKKLEEKLVKGMSDEEASKLKELLSKVLENIS